MPALIALLLALPLFAAPLPLDALRIAEVLGSEKEVKVLSGGTEKKMAAGLLVKQGDELQTAEGQTVTLSATDGSLFRIAPRTTFRIDGRRQEGSGAVAWIFHLVKGAFLGTVEKDARAKDTFRLKVKSKFAALGVRGTKFLMKEEGALAQVDVLEGTVWWGTSSAFVPGEYKTVSAGQHAETDASGKTTVSPSAGTDELLEGYGFLSKPNTAKAAEPFPDGPAKACPTSPGQKMKGTIKECTACFMDFEGEKDKQGDCLERSCPRNWGFRYQCELCHQVFRGEPGQGGTCKNN